MWMFANDSSNVAILDHSESGQHHTLPKDFKSAGGMSGDRPSWTYPKGRDIGLRSIGGGPPSRDREAPFRSLSEQRRPKESAASRLFGEDKPLKLRKTEGVEAVAAWAARREILGLLEVWCGS